MEDSTRTNEGQRKALVFGGSGQIGERLLDNLHRAGWQVSAVSRTARLARPGLEWIGGDLSGHWQGARDFDVVFSCGPLDHFARWYAASDLGPARVVAFGSTSVDVKQDSADLAERAFVGLTTDTAISQLLAAAPGMPPNVLQTPLRVSNPELLFEAVRLGLGVSVVPALTAMHPARGDLGFRVLDAPRVLRRTLLIQRPRRALSPAAQLLCEALSAQVRRLAQQEGMVLD